MKKVLVLLILLAIASAMIEVFTLLQLVSLILG